MSETPVESGKALSVHPSSNGNGAHVPGTRRDFTPEFKRAAVARLANQTVAEVSKQLDIHSTVIRRWASETPQKKKMASTTGIKGVARTATGRKIYSEAFQRAAVARLVKGESAMKIASDLKIHNSMLYGWRNKIAGKKRDPHHKPPVAGAAVSKFSDAAKRRAVDRLNAGETGAALGKEMGVSSGTVGYWRQSMASKHEKAASKGPVDPAKVASVMIAVKDAVSFLKHAKVEVHAMLQSGAIKEMDQSHLLGQLALNALLKVV